MIARIAAARAKNQKLTVPGPSAPADLVAWFGAMQAQEYEAAITLEGVRPFQPGGQKLGTWVEIGQDVIADDPELRTWLATGLRAL